MQKKDCWGKQRVPAQQGQGTLGRAREYFITKTLYSDYKNNLSMIFKKHIGNIEKYKEKILSYS